MAMTPEQLVRLAREVGQGLQRLQDEMGRDGRGYQVRFPRGYLKPMTDREGFWWVNSHTLRSNLCYHLIFGDVLRWLLNRTDLYGVARGMVVKHVIVLMGTLTESLLMQAMRQSGYGKRKYNEMLKQLK